MAIKNDMEHLVRRELSRCRERPARGQEICWCPLCEQDMFAFALNRLPPRYCQEQNFGFSATSEIGAKVRAAVAEALKKVSRRPKHRPGRPLLPGDEVDVVNYALQIGAAVARTVLAAQGGSCACPQCLADTLAYALNRYPPKYGVCFGGRESYLRNYEDFIRHEVGLVLAKASTVISAHPHH